jgi:hypothetical protein
MKMQALGWLTAGVLAAGLNSSYHNGGLEWAHRVADQLSHKTNTVLALATGNADRFYTEARVARVGEENSSPCRLSLALADMQNVVPFSNEALAQIDRASDRMSGLEQSQLARIAARRARMEAQLARVEIPAVHMQPVAVRVRDLRICPRVRVNIPRIPAVRVPVMPQIHLEIPSAGPV